MVPSAAVATGPGGRAAPQAPRSTKPHHRLDDLVREIGGRGRLRTAAAPLAWGFGGFLIGAIFWHAIGFWGFLGEVILKAPEPRVSVVARSVMPARLPNCTALAIDRTTGRTRSIPCAETAPLHEEAGLGRQDLAFVQARIQLTPQGN
jgi:hypothetical protein